MKIQYQVMGEKEIHEAHVATMPGYGDYIYVEKEHGEQSYEVKVVMHKASDRPFEAGEIVGFLRVVQA